MITLRHILHRVKLLAVTGDLDIPVSGICFDSRLAEPGNVFVAVKGTHVDGHAFIASAIEKGCTACVYQEPLTELPPEAIAAARVADAAAALGMMASEFHGNPSESLALVGVTGTNGKTTVATILHSLFRGMGYSAGLLSTIENKVNDQVVKATHTTPDPLQLQSMLGAMVDAGVDYCFMEVSSHAIDQRRISGLQFKGGVFTNLTRDHLDYHPSFEDYRDVKKAFFDGLPADAFVLSNVDDRNGRFMLQNTRAKAYRYSLKGAAEFKARMLECDFSGLKLDLDGTEFWSALVGRFNAYNLLAVYAVARLLGIEKEAILRQLSKEGPARGRFEYLRSDSGITAIVDYAHTPDALENVLRTIHDINTGQGRLIAVVGAGGDRDRGKRPLMAAVTARLADKIILTSDNPRSEDPLQIIQEMEDGIDVVDKRKVLKISDRREAIRTAVVIAMPGDVILIAGKGHEDYQEIKGIRHPFDDKKEILDAFGL